MTKRPDLPRVRAQQHLRAALTRRPDNGATGAQLVQGLVVEATGQTATVSLAGGVELAGIPAADHVTTLAPGVVVWMIGNRPDQWIIAAMSA